jgi:hypothetical protein
VKRFFVCLVAFVFLSLAPAAVVADHHEGGENPCNPCAGEENPCGGEKNPCNPCGGEKNPCGGEENPCNPCGGE